MYSTWRICELKAELKKRGASMRGKKADLVERLELYDQNFNFGATENLTDDPTMETPDAKTYWDINSNTQLPPLTKMHIRQYFCFVDKKLNEARTLYECRYLILARASTVDDYTFVKGICKKSMKSLQYEVDVKLHKNGTPEQSHCECPAGSGTEAKCKHVAVLLNAIQHMVHDKIMLLHQVCTQKIQSFHIPKAPFTASPIVAQKLPKKKPHKRFSPFDVMSVNKENYNNKIRNLILNFQNSSMPLKQMYDPANTYAIIADHAYTASDPVKEALQKLNLLNVDQNKIQNIEEVTRNQRNCSLWFKERKLRITASKFHTVCHLKPTTKLSYSKQILNEKPFSSRATTHGILNESVALNEYASKYDLNVTPCGLFISKHRPYLAASPDGLLGDNTTIEIKCPYSIRNEKITPSTVPYLVNDNNVNGFNIKKTSPYFYQIQGQLYCTNRLYCNLIVYTYKDIQVIYVTRDDDFINSMLEKFDDFYDNYFKDEILRQYLYKDYDLIKKNE